jgi:hypothetical protein
MDKGCFYHVREIAERCVNGKGLVIIHRISQKRSARMRRIYMKNPFCPVLGMSVLSVPGPGKKVKGRRFTG